MIKPYLFILVCLMLHASCKKKDIDAIPVATNKAPVAKAGDDQNIYLSIGLIVLDGSQSFDYERKKLNYLWSLVAGPGSPKLKNVKVMDENQVLGAK